MEKRSNKKIIALTSGDPCGIGPEITVRTLADASVSSVCGMLAIGDAYILEQAAVSVGIPDFLKKYGDSIYHVPCAGKIDASSKGKVRDFAGRAAYDCIKASHELCMSGRAAAVSTAPVNKEALRAADVPYIGHTEIYAALTGTDDPLTMFETRGLRIFFLTRHMSLRKAIESITAERVKRYIERCSEALDSIGVRDGELAVAGLNPHCGEHGMFGNEETDIIEPAVSEMRARGFKVCGPVSADSVFHKAYTGQYRAVLSLYHDQGHIAAKTLDFERTVSVTHSMPYLRTSVDHGTAFDIAWKGCASHISMAEAVRVALKYS